MSAVWKFLAIFAVIWLIWYWTGGPQRSTHTKPYLQYNYNDTRIYKSDATLEQGAREMVPVDAAEEGANAVGNETNNNLTNPSFTQP